MLRIYWCVLCSIPLLFVYLRLHMSPNPRSIGGVLFDSAGRFRATLLLCGGITNQKNKNQTDNSTVGMSDVRPVRSEVSATPRTRPDARIGWWYCPADNLKYPMDFLVCLFVFWTTENSMVEKKIKDKKNRGTNFWEPTSFFEILQNKPSAHEICSLLRGWINRTGIEPDKNIFLFVVFV